MDNNKNVVPFDGLIGSGKTKKQTSTEYDEVAKAILKHQKKRLYSEDIESQIAKIRLDFGNYISNEFSKSKITAGDFLKKLIKATGKKNKVFASYVGMEASNLSSIISGRRKINLDFAITLEQIFGVNASWWLEIQLKNEFLEIGKKRKKNGKKYSLKGLMKKVG